MESCSLFCCSWRVYQERESLPQILKIYKWLVLKKILSLPERKKFTMVSCSLFYRRLSLPERKQFTMESRSLFLSNIVSLPKKRSLPHNLEMFTQCTCFRESLEFTIVKKFTMESVLLYRRLRVYLKKFTTKF